MKNYKPETLTRQAKVIVTTSDNTVSAAQDKAELDAEFSQRMAGKIRFDAAGPLTLDDLAVRSDDLLACVAKQEQRICHFACDTAPVVCSNGAPAICGNDAPLLGDELAGQFAAKLNQVTARLLSDGYPSCHGEKTRQGGINVKQEKRERGHTKHLAPYPAGRQ